MTTINKSILIDRLSTFRAHQNEMAEASKKRLRDLANQENPNYPEIISLSNQIMDFDNKHHAIFMSAYSKEELEQFDTDVIVYQLQDNAAQISRQIATSNFDKHYEDSLKSVVKEILWIMESAGVPDAIPRKTEEMAASYQKSLERIEAMKSEEA